MTMTARLSVPNVYLPARMVRNPFGVPIPSYDPRAAKTSDYEPARRLL